MSNCSAPSGEQNKKPVSVVVEMPGELYDALQQFTTADGNWTNDRTMVAALRLFLLQMQGGKNGQSTGSTEGN
jgi:hypothetical protein